MKLYTSENDVITLTQVVGKGGEATVYEVTEYPDLVAKVYHHPTTTHEAKLRAMLANPPEQPATHTAMAWPIQLLYQVSPHAEFVGFLMPKVTGYEPLFKVYNPVLRKRTFPLFTTESLHRIGRNLAVVVETVHVKGYVIGDLNESNVLVNERGLVVLVDCDSFQVKGVEGEVYRCEVGKAEYTPPELQGVNFREVDQGAEHDLFGLGVLLFQLLMEGHHPFAGVLTTSLSVGRVDLYAMRQGWFPYTRNSAITPPPYAQSIHNLHPWLEAAFKKCFVEGYKQPAARPTAAQWLEVLHHAERELRVCLIDETHVYGRHLASCPKCPQATTEATRLNATLQQVYQQGLIAYTQLDVEGVAEAMTQIIRTGVASAVVYAYLGWANYQQNEYLLAIQNCTQALQMQPNLGLAHRVMGQSLMAQGWLPESIDAFDRAITYNDVSVSYYWRGLARQKLGQAEKAISDFTQAIHHGYTPVKDVYQHRSLAYEKLGQIDQAIQDTEYQRPWITQLTEQNLINTRLEQLEKLSQSFTPNIPPSIQVNEATRTLRGYTKSRYRVMAFLWQALYWPLLIMITLVCVNIGVVGFIFLELLLMGVLGYYLRLKAQEEQIRPNLHLEIVNNAVVATYVSWLGNTVYRVPVNEIKDIYIEVSLGYADKKGKVISISYILYVINHENEYKIFLDDLVDREQAKSIQTYLRKWLNL